MKSISQTRVVEIEKSSVILDNIMNNKQLIGSKTAKEGFENEYNIVTKFNNYNIDIDAQSSG